MKPRDLLVSLLLLILGAFLGAFASYRFDQLRRNEDETPRYIDYEIESRPIFPPGPCIPGKDVSITLGGKDVSGATRLDLSVYNFSDRDFDNVRFYIDLAAKEPTAGLSGLVLAESASGVNSIPDSVARLTHLEPSSRSGVARFGYKVLSLNRSARLRPSFTVSYFFAGDAAPTLEVNTDTAGIELRRLSRDNIPLQESWCSRTRRYLPHGIAILLLLVVAWCTVGRILSKKTGNPDLINKTPSD